MQKQAFQPLFVDSRTLRSLCVQSCCSFNPPQGLGCESSSAASLCLFAGSLRRLPLRHPSALPSHREPRRPAPLAGEPAATQRHRSSLHQGETRRDRGDEEVAEMPEYQQRDAQVLNKGLEHMGSVQHILCIEAIDVADYGDLQKNMKNIEKCVRTMRTDST